MRREGRMLLFLACLVLVFFGDTLVGSEVLATRDTVCTFVPWHQFLRQAFAEGALPLWNHYANCGDPLLANPQYAAYYPPNLIFHLIPSTVIALELWIVLHMTLPAWGFYGLLRHHGLLRPAAVLGAVSFTFSTYVVVRLEYHSCFGALVWTPLLLLCTARIVSRLRELEDAPLAQRLREVLPGAIPLSLVIAVQFLAGYPQQLLFGLFLAFGYALSRNAAWRSARGAGQAGGILLLAGGVAILLSACQLLPSLELIPHSTRVAGYDPAADSASLHPRMLLGWLLPYIGGRPGYLGEWWGSKLSSFEFWVGTGYVGILPLILASLSLCALARPRRRFALGFFLGATLVGLLLAAGKYTPAYGLFYEHAPLFNRLRFPSKSLIFVVVGLSGLAGLGLQDLLERPGWTRGRAVVLAGWGLLLGVLLLGAPFVGPGTFESLTGGAYVDEPGRPERYEGLLSDLRRLRVFLGAALACALALVWAKAPLLRWRLAGLAVGLTFANLLLVSGQHHARTDPSVYTYMPPRLAALAGEHQRVATPYFHWGQQILYGVKTPQPFLLAREAGVGNSSLPLRISKIKGGGGLHRRRYKAFSDPVYSLPDGDPTRERILDLLSVTAEVRGPPVGGLLSGAPPSSIQFRQRSTALPRAMLVEAWQVIPEQEAVERELLRPGFDLRNQVLLSADPGVSPGGGPGRAVPDVRSDWNRVSVRARAERPCVLLLNDSFFPGWKAHVDGQPVPLLRANGFFRAVAFPAGEHEVSMVYDPWPAKLGLTLSLLTLLVLAALGWRFRPRRGSP